MQLTDDYLTKLLQVVQAHAQVPCTEQMITLIKTATVRKMTPMELNVALIHALSMKEGIWTRVKHALIKNSKARADKQKLNLKNALEAVMREVFMFHRPLTPRTPRGNEPQPSTPDSFGRELYTLQLKAWETDVNSQKINSSLEDLKTVYNKHQAALKDPKLDPHQRSYHQQRVDTILNWIKAENFHILIGLIKAMNSDTRKKEFPLDYDNTDSPDTIKHKKEVLNWLGIILENPAASENPYAMIEILRLNALTGEEFIQETNRFSQIYVDENSPGWINIDSDLRNKFTSQLTDKNIKALRNTLIEIYEVMHGFVLNAEQVENQLRKLESEINLDHPSNRGSRESSMKDSSSSSSPYLSSMSKRSFIKSGPSSPILAAARPVENSESSKSTLNPWQ